MNAVGLKGNVNNNNDTDKHERHDKAWRQKKSDSGTIL